MFRGLNTAWTRRSGRLFQHHQVPEPRTSRRDECGLRIRSPKASRVAQCLFNAVVKVVAERSDVSLDLNHCDEIVPRFDDEIPILCRPEVARKRGVLGEDLRVGDACLAHDVGEKAYEAVSVLASGDRCSAACIFLAAVAALLFFLAGADLPEMADGFAEF